TTPRGLLAAPVQHRPTYLAAGLAGLLAPHPAPRPDGSGGWRCGGFTATGGRGGLRLGGDGGSDEDALRALCACAWADSGPPGTGDAPGGVVATTPAAETAVRLLGL